MSRGAAPLPGVDSATGRVQECESSSHVSTSVSVLPQSLSQQLRSVCTHQFPRRVLTAYCPDHLQLNRTMSHPSLDKNAIPQLGSHCITLLSSQGTCERANMNRGSPIATTIEEDLEDLHNGDKYLRVTVASTVLFDVA